MSKRKLTSSEIQDIISELHIIGPKHFKTSIHENIVKKLTHQLENIELYPDMFNEFKTQIIEQYYKSHISPGENVGILTAQSIGEKQTQMSLAYDELVYIKYKGIIQCVYMGKFIDDMMNLYYSKLIHLDKGSWILDTSSFDLYSCSVDTNQNVTWSKITCLSKHLPNGNLAQVTTKSGKRVLCTYSHSLLTLKDSKIIPIKTSDAVVGTIVPILQNYMVFQSNKTLSHNTAKIYGLFYKYGKISGANTTFKCTTRDEYLLVYNYAQCNIISVTLDKLNITLLDWHVPKCESIPLYILSNGSNSDISEFLSIVYKDDLKLLSNISHINGDYDELNLLANIVESNKDNQQIYWDTITNIKPILEKDYRKLYNYVYDFSVENDETFMLTNGLFVHNTLNSVIGSELIHYYDSQGINHITTIGHFIDTCMEQASNDITLIPENNTEYLELKEPVKILSVTEGGQIEWSKVTAVTRHDIKEGDLIQVETKLGHVVTATKHKSFFTRFNNQLIQKTTPLQVGDVFPIVQKSPFLESNQHTWQGYDLDYDLGFFISMFYLHGNVNEHRTVITTHTIEKQSILIRFASKYGYKYVDYFNGLYVFSHQLCSSFNLLQLDILPTFLFTAPPECIRGFLYGLFFKNAYCYASHPTLQRCIADLATRFGLVIQVQDTCLKIVNYIDYVSCIVNGDIVTQYTLHDTIPGVTTFTQNGTFPRGELHRLRLESINISDRQVFQNTLNQTVYYDTVTKITPIYNRPKVYDLTVDNKTFSLLGGSLVYDTFHTAGLTVKTVVSGVPRFMELMNTTKEPKSASCSIKVPVSDTIKGINDIRNYIGDKLRCLQLTRVLYDYNIVSFGDIKTDWWIVDEKFPIECNDDDRILRLQLSHKLIYEYRCSLTSIVNKINNVFTDIYTVCSSLNECIIDVFILNKGVITLDKKICHVTKENKYDVFLEEIVLAKLDKFIISGVEKINDYMISTIKPGHEWMISTEGSNLKGLMELDMFDFNNVMSNNMWEIYNLLGIEAAREFLIREFTDVISSDGTFINKCHILLLVDTMTCKGDITSISRYSLRSKSSVLSRSSFEESIENFLKSGIFSEIDKMSSISSNIMTGKLSHVGTGICEVILADNVFEKQELYPSESIYDVKSKLVNEELVLSPDSIHDLYNRLFDS